MFPIAQNSLFLVIIVLLPAILKITTSTDDQKITDLTLCIVSSFVIFFLIKVPWDVFQARSSYLNNSAMHSSYDNSLSIFSAFLFILNILCPFISVSIIRHLKVQYANESSILHWINLELITCVSLLRPLIFLANKLGSSPKPSSSLTITDETAALPHQYHENLMIKVAFLEERIKVLEESVAMSISKQYSQVFLSPSPSSLANSTTFSKRPVKRNIFATLISWYLMVLGYLFKRLVPFSSMICAVFNKEKSE